MRYTVGETLISEEQIKNRVAELGKQISEDYKGQSVLCVGILKGTVVFMTDLIRAIDGDVRIDLMAVSSYGASTKSSGVVRILKDLDAPIKDENILIVEDIVDSGLTLNYIRDHLAQRGPKSIKICTLFDKPARRKVDLKSDYVGFEIPDAFIVGYGLDVDEHYRNLPFIATVTAQPDEQ